MAYASPEDVAKRLQRDLTTAEIAAVDEFLDDAEADILTRYPDIRSSTDPSYLRRLLRVECSVAMRLLAAPPYGVVQSSESVDDYQRSFTFGRSNSPASPQLTDDEWEALLPTGYASGSQAFEIVLG